MSLLNAEENEWFNHNLYVHETLLRSWLRCRFPGLKAEVEDIIQETFMKVMEVQRANALDCPKTFLFASARNLAIDYLRRKNVVQFIPLVESGSSFVFRERETIPKMLSKVQEQEMLTKAIGSLPRRCREVITLRKVEGLSHKDISKQLGISKNTIEAQVSVGVRKLRDYFKNYMKEIKE